MSEPPTRKGAFIGCGIGIVGFILAALVIGLAVRAFLWAAGWL